MPSLAELLAGQTSFDEIRRRGQAGSSMDNQQELASQAMRNAQQPRPVMGMLQQPPPISLLDLLRHLKNAGPAFAQSLMGVPISPPTQPQSDFMGVRG